MNGEGGNTEPRPKRRARYRGTHPRRFAERYKELDAEHHPEILEHVRGRGNTPAGTHVPIMVEEVLASMALAPGAVVADGTLGWGGHTERILEAIGPGGIVHGFDVDGIEITKTRQRLERFGERLVTHHASYASLPEVMASSGIPGFDAILVDLGVSSMQIDDPARGFSFKHKGPLDMRMDRRIEKTAADHVANLDESRLGRLLEREADEHHAKAIAAAIVREREIRPIDTTQRLAAIVCRAKGLPDRVKDDGTKAHPAARTFQALRILVNEELSHLERFLAAAPHCLRPGGKLSILTFQSGEEKRVLRAITAHAHADVLVPFEGDPLRATPEERYRNPRSAPARLWVVERRT